jgi:8-oxo-dGTP pyrophosphatase MutT (NUDIX family)
MRLHSWFPARWLSSIVGQPTGTSPKFASMMATAVREYLEERGCRLEGDALTSIALEGEGKIEDRVQRCVGPCL